MADACFKSGEIGALLRREGFYIFYFFVWRRQRDEGAFVVLARPCGRRKPHPLEVENIELCRWLDKAEADFIKVRKVIEV